MKKQDLIDLLGQNIEVSDKCVITHDGACMVVKYRVDGKKQRAFFRLDKYLADKLIGLYIIYRYEENGANITLFGFDDKPVQLSGLVISETDAKNLATQYHYRDALHQSGTILHRVGKVVNMFSSHYKQTA